jgi:hypothetical protein
MTYVNISTEDILEATTLGDVRERVAFWCRAVAVNLHDHRYSINFATALTLSGHISFGNARRLELLDQRRWCEEAREEYIRQDVPA